MAAGLALNKGGAGLTGFNCDIYVSDCSSIVIFVSHGDCKIHRFSGPAGEWA